MSDVQFEPMSVGGILDKTFRLYKKHFIRFLTIVAVVQVPLALISLAVIVPMTSGSTSGVAQTGAARTGTSDLGTSGGAAMLAVAGGLLGALFFVIGVTLCNAALIKSVSESYLGNDVTVGAAYRFILPKVLTIIIANILVSIFVGFGILLLIIPGVIFMAWYALTTQVIVIEDVGVMEGVRRSKELATGNRGKVLGVLFLVGLLSGLIGAVGKFAAEMVVRVLFQPGGPAGLIFSTLVEMATDVLAAPIPAAAMILLYYDLRIRKEGFDLQMLARQMSAEALPVSSNAPNV